MGLTNFLNNWFGLNAEPGVAGSGGDASGVANSGPGGVGNNPESTYADLKLAPGVPSVMAASVYAAGGELHGRTLMNYSGGGWDIAGQIRPIQGGFGDLYSFRVHAPPVPKRMMGANEIAYQIQRNISGDANIAMSAPPVPTNGWLPPALQVPFD